MKMEETEKLRAISEIAALLRETTTKEINFTEDDGNITHTVYKNMVFNEEEHETVKRKFLKLLHSL